MTVRFSAAVPPFMVNYPSPTAPTGVPFSLDNFTSVLLQLAILDYEEWAMTENADDERVLFCIDASTDNTESAQGNLAVTTKDLYLVRAYFEGGENIDMVIQKSNRSEAIRLQIVTDMGAPAFRLNDSYQVLSFKEADRLINRMEN